MNRVAARMALFALVQATTLLACSQGEPSLEQGARSYDEFRAGVFQDPSTGVFFVDGDLPVVGEQALREFFDQLSKPGLATREQDLVVHLTANRSLSSWSDAQRGNLSYCISSTFGSRYEQVRSAVATAASEWSQATANSVRFVHDASQDANCTNANNNVIFNVAPVNETFGPLARAFLPHQPRNERTLSVNERIFDDIAPLTVTGNMRHELGHILGFRHEFTRPEAASNCFEDNNWYPLTAYDSDSVMHSPAGPRNLQCNGTHAGDFELTALDRAGAAMLYPVYAASLTEVQGRWIRLTNSFLGPLNSLDTFSGGYNDPFMLPTGNYSGQYWFLSSLGNGWFRLSNGFLGGGRSLDTYGDTYAPFMGSTGNFSGQFWTLTPYGDRCFRLNNLFLGPGWSLDTYANGTPFMGTTGNYSGQCWHLTAL